MLHVPQGNQHLSITIHIEIEHRVGEGSLQSCCTSLKVISASASHFGSRLSTETMKELGRRACHLPEGHQCLNVAICVEIESVLDDRGWQS